MTSAKWELRAAVALVLLVLAAGSLACGAQPVDPLPLGRVRVRVHWQDLPSPGKRVELVEHGAIEHTDADGLAEFLVPAGDHTVRVWAITGGGPARRFVDTHATVRPGATTRVEILDCLPCV